MFDAKTHELLCLFSAMILADKKVYAVEIDSFVESTTKFYRDLDVLPAPSEARLLMWFEINRVNITAKLSNDKFEAWFEALMNNVTKNYPPRQVFNVLSAISQSDDEEHISETALMVLVGKSWTKAA